MNKKIKLLLTTLMAMGMVFATTACEGMVVEVPGPGFSAETTEDFKVKVDVMTADELAEVNAKINATEDNFYNLQTEKFETKEITLESGYVFTAKDSFAEAQACEYAKWNADYCVYVDQAIEADQLGMAGSYDYWDNGDWLAFYMPALKAGERVNLLETAGITWTYEEVVEYIKVFKCGVFDNENACSGMTLYVELRVTNPENAEDYIVVNKAQYKFA